MWVSHVMDRYTIVLILQLLCILPEHMVHVQAKDTCQVGQEKNQKGQWRWVLPYEYPCECGKIIYGGMNTVTPKRPFKPVYVKEPMVGDNVGEIRDHYGLNCSEVRCPTHRLGRAQQGRVTRRFPNETVTAVDNHGKPLNVSCNPALRSEFNIGRKNVSCKTTDQRGYEKRCTFEVHVLDFDECNTTKSHNCSANAVCVNTDGSYNCSCIHVQGYRGDGFECVDIDECTTQSHNCSANAACNNTDGSYNCSCNQGYQGDGFECADIDECTTQSHNCSTNAACNNTDGSYNCSCNQGYQGDGFECVDINECTAQSHNCSTNAACNNLDGNYSCSCNQGYEGVGFECVAYCPGGWILPGRYCFAHGFKKTFQQARTHCQDLGGELVNIHDDDEQRLLAQHTSEDGYHGQWWGYWIGLNDRNTEGEFEWTDGTQNDFLYWNRKEPNDWQGQDCVVMDPKRQDKWIDESCDKKYPYICMKTP